MQRKIFYLFVVSIFAAGIVSAQVPDKFKNLKVLPKDISKEKLLEIMRGFTGALGVNCEFCHVAQENPHKMIFDSDQKTAKNKARIMMAMTHDINTKYLSKLSEYSDNILQVKCVTCHHGNKEPMMLEDVLYSTINSKGIQEAITTYHDLRDKYYGSFTYDFKDHTLVKLIEMLNKDKKYDDAVAIGKLNIETYPQSGVAYYGLGEAYEAKNDKENAIANYKKALELMPRAAEFLNKKIEALQGK